MLVTNTFVILSTSTTSTSTTIYPVYFQSLTSANALGTTSIDTATVNVNLFSTFPYKIFSSSSNSEVTFSMNQTHSGIITSLRTACPICFMFLLLIKKGSRLSAQTTSMEGNASGMSRSQRTLDLSQISMSAGMFPECWCSSHYQRIQH